MLSGESMTERRAEALLRVKTVKNCRNKEKNIAKFHIS